MNKSENDIVCGCGCNCSKSSGNKKLKAVVCLVVLLAVCGIFIYKAKAVKQTAGGDTSVAFAAPAVNEQSVAVTNIDKQEPVSQAVEIKEIIEQQAESLAVEPTETAAKTVEKQKKVGELLDSIVSLNKVAANQDAVFIFVPANNSDIVSNEISNAIASAKQKIEAKGLKLGLYTLQSSSPEYANLASQLTLPGMLVMSKGKGMGSVSGGITEEKILQAYVASSRAGGCGPSGCGPSGCSPAAPALGPRL